MLRFEATGIESYVGNRVQSFLVPAVLGLALTVPVHAQERGQGPSSLVLTYQCKPEKRPAFRTHMMGPGSAQFEKWKKERLFEDYLILFSSFVNPYWDMLIRLDFDRYVDTGKWKQIERGAPGGLSADGLAICSPTNAHFVDLKWGKTHPSRDIAKSVYLVMPFQFRESRAHYLSYFEAKPKYDLDAWVEDGAVSQYGVYLNQHVTGAEWEVLWFVEYRDLAALANREAVKQPVRTQLLEGDNPALRFTRRFGSGSKAPNPGVIADPILAR